MLNLDLSKFEDCGDRTVDSRRRISLKAVGYHSHIRYKLQEDSTGRILLTPMVSVLASEIAKFNSEVAGQ